MKPRFLSKVIFLSSLASENGDYELIHCNNPETNEPEMKFRISKQFYDMYFDQLALDIIEVCSKNKAFRKISKLSFLSLNCHF